MKSGKVFHSALTAGLFASLIFLVNCDNSNTRSIRALMPANKLDASQLPPCTSEIVDLLSERSRLVEDLVKKITAARKTEPTSEMKAELKQVADNLRAKSDEIFKNIRQIKNNHEGCNTVGGENKKVVHLIENMNLENLRLGKSVTEITGEASSLTDTDAGSKSAKMTEQQSYKPSDDLARVMVEAKVKKMYLLEGKVFDGAGVADDLAALKESKYKSFCSLEVSTGDLTSDDLLRVIQIQKDISADQKTATAHVRMAAKGDQLYSFSCSLKKASEISEQLREIFGDLITLKNGVGSSGDVNTGHH